MAFVRDALRDLVQKLLEAQQERVRWDYDLPNPSKDGTLGGIEEPSHSRLLFTCLAITGALRSWEAHCGQFLDCTLGINTRHGSTSQT